MVVSCALAAFMGPVEEIVALVSGARGVKVPDTEDQRRYIENFVGELRNQRDVAPGL